MYVQQIVLVEFNNEHINATRAACFLLRFRLITFAKELKPNHESLRRVCGVNVDDSKV